MGFGCLNGLRPISKGLQARGVFAAGALAIYIVTFLAEGALSLLWEKVLEREAPRALRQVSEFLATDLATGMALMAALVLFVPPITQWLFETSARFTRFMELRGKRVSKRDYLAEITLEAISLAKEARGIVMMDKWDYAQAIAAELSGQDAIQAIEKVRAEQSDQQRRALRSFVAARQGRMKFLMAEFVSYGYAKEVPREVDHFTTSFCVATVANALEGAAHSVQAELVQDGYLMPKNTNDERFDRLLAAMTGPSAEIPTSAQKASSQADPGDCDETQTHPDTSKDASG